VVERETFFEIVKEMRARRANEAAGVPGPIIPDAPAKARAHESPVLARDAAL
jgi:hypothetical protein